LWGLNTSAADQDEEADSEQISGAEKKMSAKGQHTGWLKKKHAHFSNEPFCAKTDRINVKI
jgi:hypothetical protein